MKLQAGYFIESLKSVLESAYGESVSSILYSLSVFDYEVNTIPRHRIDEKHAPILKVIQNLIARGTPTRMTLNLEQSFGALMGSKELEQYGSIYFNYAINEELMTLCFRAIHVIDPRFDHTIAKSNYKQSWERLDSSFEEDFLFNSLPSALGDDLAKIAIQLIDTQRPVQSLTNRKFAQEWLGTAFNQQLADFVLEFPSSIKNRKGFIVEVDGSQHEEDQQRRLDAKRDEATHQNGWNSTIRIKTRDWNLIRERLKPLSEALSSEEFEPYLDNIKSPLYNISEGLIASILTLSPIAIARIQRAVVEMIQSGHLDLNASKWNIAVYERDVPCAHWAFKDLRTIIESISSLTDEGFSLPEINLCVFRTDEFKKSPIDEPYYSSFKEFSSSAEKFDAIVDISVLRRDAIMDDDVQGFNASVTCTIRSTKNSAHVNKIATDRHVRYKPFVNRLDVDRFETIENQSVKLQFFLQWVFRKRDFRSGQLPILDRALRGESVIGLLPTGGGKSLTYQLAALMQPGITLIVDPIKSLMKDQVDGLSLNQIGSSVFINSSVKGEDRALAEEMLANGERQFVFVSPERLQIVSFRQLLNGMHARGVFFSYCVIDEAHCVSEWGHDFRTSYLSLGENARKFCKPAIESHLPLFGLTATASFDVLADVQRELSPIHGVPISDEAVVRLHSTKRPELQYRIIEVSAFKEKTTEELARLDVWGRKKEIAINKKKALQKLLDGFPVYLNQFNEDLSLSYSTQEHEEDSEKIKSEYSRWKIPNYKPRSFFDDTKSTNRYENAGVIFCPHRTWHFGVTDKYNLNDRGLGVADSINIPAPIGTYLGASDDDDAVNARIEIDNERNQSAFKNNDIALLVATKAFGMGIDKPNIRYAVHFNYPQSIESFVQEAGRAGRDGKLAIGHILFNDEPMFTAELRDNDRSSSFIWEEEKSEHLGYKKIKVPWDVSLLLDFHNRSFQGEDKEKWTIHELLTEIHSPAGARLTEFYSVAELSPEISLKVLDAVMFVDGENRATYGFIRLDDLSSNTTRSTMTVAEAKPVLDKVIAALAQLKEDNDIQNLRSWFANDSGSTSEGLESILSRTEVGNRFEIDVSFTTNKPKIASKLVELIMAHTNVAVAANVILGYYQDSFGKFTEFVDKLGESNATIRNCLVEKPEFAKAIEARYNRFRERGDTEKAIYRLNCLGVIDDYSVDYKNSIFSLSGVKKADGSYNDDLRSYIKRYYSDSRADREINSLKERKGNTELQKCVNLLIEFVYREIEKKRFMAISAMRQACLIGSDSAEGNVLFKEFIDLYFFSKYARSGFVTELAIDGDAETVDASLLDRTDLGKETKIDWVWEFIRIAHYDRSGPQLDNFKHLRGACTRILTSNPSNSTLLILQSFAQFFIELNSSSPSIRQLELARDSFLSGFRLIKETESEEQLDITIEAYSHELKNALGELAWKMDEFFNPCLELFWLEQNRIWTEIFNTQFDYGNERADSRRVKEIKN
jgi:ATP-dependent DNA helicase RecQ